MTFRMSRTSRAKTITFLVIGVIGATLSAMLFAGPAAGATPAEAGTPKIFDGDSYTSEPDTLWGWRSTLAVNSPPAYIAGRNAKRVKPGSLGNGTGEIKWTRWNDRRADGIGDGYTFICPRASADCGGHGRVFPWEGTRLLITAYRNRNDSFTRLKVATQNYRMYLKMVGNKWEIAHIDNL